MYFILSHVYKQLLQFGFSNYNAANMIAEASGPETLQRCSPACLAQRRIGQPEALCLWQ
jgi:hypothetical protein